MCAYWSWAKYWLELLGGCWSDSPISGPQGWKNLSYQRSGHCYRVRTAPSIPCHWISAHMSTCICHLPINSNHEGKPETLNSEAQDTNPIYSILFRLLPSYQMINGDTAVMSPEACGYTTQLSLAELEFRDALWLAQNRDLSGTLANQEKRLSPFIKHYTIKWKGWLKNLRSILSEPRDWKQEERDK